MGRAFEIRQIDLDVDGRLRPAELVFELPHAGFELLDALEQKGAPRVPFGLDAKRRERSRRFFVVLSATQTSRIEAAIAALPPEGKRTVLKFFVGMVEPGDRPTLDRLKLTEDI